MDFLDCCHLVEDKEFRERVSRYLKVVTPLMKVHRMVDGDDNDIAFLNEAMDRAKLELPQSLPRDYKKWTPEKRLEDELQMDAYRMRIGIYSDSQLQYVVGKVSPGFGRN
ncbi:hypothetical protein Taro_011813 [Colocasia esculenta]|uniref:Uncharacterized protein n=1 Tax=Colocasia esculenta TaxID=4460 RepID=A0A843UH74_COLES|nr:hypothetical protein [Colocasia esculenta]